jgi:hypothetical protein
MSGALGIDERTSAELIAFARRFASQLLWYDGGNQPAGWWASPEPGDETIGLPDEPPRAGPAFFDGVGPAAAAGLPVLGYDEVAAFLADPAAHTDERYSELRRPHMALFLSAVRLIRHGQRALNALTERHLDYHLMDVLRLRPRSSEPDQAFVLFELAAGVRAAEAPEGLRLLAGRDSRHRDRVYRLDTPVVLNRAQVARIASTFVDREIVSLAGVRREITGTPEEQFLFLVSLALGYPKPGDALPPMLGKPVDVPLLEAAGDLIAFSRSGLFLELFELRAMLARKAMRSTEAADWQTINGYLERAGRAKRGDPAWQLQTAKPADFYGNLELAMGGKPDLGGLTEVETVDDLALHLDRPEVLEAIKTRLFMEADQFRPMIVLKRSIDADWRIVNGYLELAGRRKRDKPDWSFQPRDQSAFADNLAAAVGPIKWSVAGSAATGVTDPDSYLSRLQEIEAWFFLSAEDAARLIAAYKDERAGARSWRDAYALLRTAHGRKVRAQEAAELGELRKHPPEGRSGVEAMLEAALGEMPIDLEGRMEALGRYVPAEDMKFVRTVLKPPLPRDSAAGWTRVYAILADARRRRLRLPEPIAQREHWRALWDYEDARSASPAAGAAWRCFGGVPPDQGPAHVPAGIGWAIASPVLALSAGRRRITLTLAFRDDGGGPLVAPIDDHGDSVMKIPFLVTLSGGKGWIEPQETRFAPVDYWKLPGIEPVQAGIALAGLQITLTLDETAPEIAPSPESSRFGETAWPVLRLMLRPVWDEQKGRFDTAYERFRALKLERVSIACAVGSFVAPGAPGLWPLEAETETGVANAKKPFEPFGPSPSIGSELALGHRDLLHKRLSQLSLSFEWLGGPSSLNAYYKNYSDRSFLAQLSLVDRGTRTSELAGKQRLFTGDDTGTPVKIQLPTGDSAPPDAVVQPLDPEVRSWRRFLIVRLTGDFGHQEYPTLVAGKSIALANDLRAAQPPKVNAADYTVSPPYTPKLKRIGLDFTAAQEVRPDRYEPSSAIDRLFHVHPFGVEEAPPGGAEGWALLPDYDEEGALYIGLKNVEAPQTLSLLFAGADGDGSHDRAGPVRWSYLDSHGWSDFPEPPQDGTGGLVRRGIVQFVLPLAKGGTRMPAGFYWLRAAMATGAANAFNLTDIHAQAGSAHFVDDGESPGHYDAPIQARTIRGLAERAPGIARVVQPYQTSGGRAPEGEGAFRTRAAERLRHKGRALTLWDYERLVLERFPEVHKVKCLPAETHDDAPGMVKLVVIPDLRGKARRDAFAPRAPARLLDEIAAYLTPLSPPTATIAAVHARFVQVRIRLGVRFRRGGDEEFDKRRLAEQLNRHLAPWAFEEGSEIAIGQRIDATSIVAFVDSLEFVDFVGACRLFASEDEGATFQLGEDDGDRVEASGADQVLTPASRHEIDVIGKDLFGETEFTGIGYMKVELDFVIH